MRPDRGDKAGKAVNNTDCSVDAADNIERDRADDLFPCKKWIQKSRHKRVSKVVPTKYRITPVPFKEVIAMIPTKRDTPKYTL